jgi:hypothetical protein
MLGCCSLPAEGRYQAARKAESAASRRAAQFCRRGAAIAGDWVKVVLHVQQLRARCSCKTLRSPDNRLDVRDAGNPVDPGRDPAGFHSRQPNAAAALV